MWRLRSAVAQQRRAGASTSHAAAGTRTTTAAAFVARASPQQPAAARTITTTSGDASNNDASSAAALPRRALYSADRRASANRMRDASAAATQARLRELLAARRSLAASKFSAHVMRDRASQVIADADGCAAADPSAFKPLPKATRAFLTGSRSAYEAAPESEVSPALQAILREMHQALDSSHPDLVFRLFQDAQRNPALGALHPELYNCLILALKAMKQPAAAVEVFDSMWSHGVAPDFHTLLAINGLLVGGNIHLAYDMLLLAHRQFHSASEDRKRFESTGEEERPPQERFWAADEMEWFNEDASAAAAAADADAASAASGPVRFRLPSVTDTAEEWWMHSALVGSHITFLRMSSGIAKGHSGKEFLSSFLRTTLEPFLIAYLQAFAAIAREQLHSIARVYQQGKAAASAVDPALIAQVSPGLGLVQPGDTLAPPSSFQWLYQQVLQIESSLLMRHTSRGAGQLARAEQSWARFHEFQANRALDRWWGTDSRSAALGIVSLRRFETLIEAAGDVHHGLAVLDREHEGPKERNERLAEASARIYSDGDDPALSLPPPASPDVWRERTRGLYAQFWRYLQHLLLASSSADWTSDVYALGRKIGVSRADLLKQSHVATLEWVSKSEEQAQGQATPETKSAPVRPVQSNTEAPGLLDVIQSIAEQQERSERVLSKLEGPWPHSAADRASEDEDFATQAAVAPEDAAAISAPSDRLVASDSAVSEAAEVIPPVSKRAASVSSASVVDDDLPSLLPPGQPFPLLPAMQDVISRLYRTLISTQLLYGASTSARVVTPASHARNKELIHALYLDYMSLRLPSPDTTIILLAHIAHAPLEFQSSLFRAGALVAEGASSKPLWAHLFSGVFVTRPISWERRVWGHYSAADAGADLAPGELHAGSGALPKDKGAWRDWMHNRNFTRATSSAAQADSAFHRQSNTSYYPTSLEKQKDDEHWFAEVWDAYHVAPLLEGGRPQFDAALTDLSFRRRTYRLIEELHRRGISPSGANDPLLPLMIKSLAFTSYSSRFDPETAEQAERAVHEAERYGETDKAAVAALSASRHIGSMSFEDRLKEVYPAHIVHIRRVLRVLFEMVARHGFTPGVDTVATLVKAAVRHKVFAEAYSILGYASRMWGLALSPALVNILLDSGVATKSNPRFASIAMRDVESALNDMVAHVDAGDAVIKREIASIKARAKIHGETLARATRHLTPASTQSMQGLLSLDPRAQLVETFNKLLDGYRITKDLGGGMLRIHERMFELGLRPNATTLDLSLEILLSPGNSSSYRTAMDLLSHALAPPHAPRGMEPQGNLQAMMAAVESSKREVKAAREKARADRERNRREEEMGLISPEEIAARKAKEEAANAEVVVNVAERIAAAAAAAAEPGSAPAAAAAAASTAPAVPSAPSEVAVPLDTMGLPHFARGAGPAPKAPFDPVSSPAASSVAIAFSYASWAGTKVSHRSWAAVIEAAGELGMWDEQWSVFQRMIAYISQLPASDPDTTLYLTDQRWLMIRSLLRGVLNLQSRYAPSEVAWFLQRLVRQLRPFASRTEAGSALAAGSMRSFSLTHPHLSLLLTDPERKELERIAKLYETASASAGQAAAAAKYGASGGWRSGVRAPKGYSAEDSDLVLQPASESLLHHIRAARAEQERLVAEEEAARKKAATQPKQHAAEPTPARRPEDANLSFL